VRGFGGYPQQAVVAIDYSPKVEMYIPPLLATKRTRNLQGKKWGKLAANKISIRTYFPLMFPRISLGEKWGKKQLW